MTVKEMVMIKETLCKTRQSDQCNKNCLLYECEDCRNIHDLNDFLTPAKEEELMDWYHKNASTYLNNFCKKFPNADREYVVRNICCRDIYHGRNCRKCDDFKRCTDHWNSIMENE